MDGSGDRISLKVAEDRVTILHAPEDRLEAVFDLIESARTRLTGFFYMIEADSIGERVRDALCDAARRGVEVEFGVDCFGSSKIDDAFFEPLRAEGARCYMFSPRWTNRYLIRNHQKFLVADDERALAGGFNLTEAYFGMKGEKSWEDLGILVEGPSAASLGRYASILHGLSDNGRVKLKQLRRELRKWQQDDGRNNWLVGWPSGRLSHWAASLKRDLQKGKRIDIVPAYFSPGRGLLRRMKRVARQGRARFIMAGMSDNGATIGASRLLYGQLLKRGAEIYEFQPRLLHMKLIVIDDIVYIGSSNLDARSLFINLELMLRMEDGELARRMRELIDRMQEESEAQTPELHARRKGPLTLTRWALSYFLVSVLDYTVSRRLNFGL